VSPGFFPSRGQNGRAACKWSSAPRRGRRRLYRPGSVFTTAGVCPAREAPVSTAPPDSNYLNREVERWFLELRDSIFRYLRTLGCRPSLAEEITQEVFLRLHCGLQDGIEVNDVRAWLFRVARNLWIDSRREHQRYWTATRDDGKRPDLALTDSAPDPEQQALLSQRIRLFDEEVLRLPDLQRACMQLKSQGLHFHEIALALDMPMSAAVDCVRRAVKRLRERLND
jgi:RNA polymerase sigma factor (sigma-70 family)